MEVRIMKKLTFRRSLTLAGAALMLVGCLTVRPLTASAVTVKEGSSAVVTADKLYIRSGPGTNYAIRGSLTNGYKVEVLEVSGNWARTPDGWLCTDYLSISGAAGVTKGSKVKVTADYLNIRQGAGTSYARVGRLTRGTEVEILDVKDGWGKMKDGWISLQFVATINGGSGSNSGSGSASTGFAKGDTVYISADRLNIRSGPSTGYNKVGYLTNGYKVQLLEIQNGWGRISEGWISLNFVRKGGSSNGSVSAGNTVVVTADRLNIRQGAGTDYARVGSLNQGVKVDILEVKGNWGKIRQGWISLTYVRPVSGQAASFQEGDRVVVTASSLNIRSGAGTNYARRGSLTSGYSVPLLEVNGSWGRIGEGWICLNYVRKA